MPFGVRLAVRITVRIDENTQLSILIIAATHSPESPPHVLTDRRNLIAWNAATRSYAAPPPGLVRIRAFFR
jgi:hypothetical protein